MQTFSVPSKKQIRVIIDTDTKAEADDQFAIVHALLTPKFQIKGLIGAHFGAQAGKGAMELSCGECRRLTALMGLEDEVPVYEGARTAVSKDGSYEYSPGARLIVQEALLDHEAPLFVVFQGPITDLACAYLAHPEIAGRLTAIWIGGGPYPDGGWEFNMLNDIVAANIIFKSEIDLWQVPMDVYGKMLVSLTELEMKVAPCGRIGDYLFRQMVEFNDANGDRPGWPCGESWCLGDSPVVGLMLDPMRMCYSMREAPVVDERLGYHFDGHGRQIRVYHDINERFILEDFFAKLKKYSERSEGGA